MADGTGKVDYNSPIKRKAWMSEGLVQKSATSWWAPYKGKTFDSIIMTENNISAGSGHLVTFDFDGNLSGRPVKGNTTAKGTGEQKKKFSTSVTVSDYRYVVDNGTKFDGIDIGDLNINEHLDSRNKLGDLWVRSEDQAYFDLAQQGAEFGIDLGADATFDDLLAVEEVVKNGTGFDTTPVGITKRLPLKPYILASGDPVWLWVVDVSFKRKMLASSGMQTMLQNADVRGNDNRLIKGVLGKIGNFLFVEAGSFFGTTVGDILDANGYYNYDNTGVEMAGLRTYDVTNSKWSGEEGFSRNNTTLKSRSVILGAGAFQKGNGLMPNYEYEATDFKKFSESCLETWCGAKCVKLEAENSDNTDGKIAGYNWGVIFVDVTIQTAG